MLWPTRLGIESLLEVCRSLRYSLSSGMTLVDGLALLARDGTVGVRGASDRVVRDLKAGWSFQEALGRQGRTFPSLFVSLAAVGEDSGNLPEVMGEMERYYLLQLKMRREFVSGISRPVAQFVAAVLIITGLIYVLGELLPKREGPPLDPLGLGLLGREGAITFLLVVVGVLAGAYVLIWVLRRLLRRRAVVERASFHIPVLGPYLKALALTRFSVALQLMLDTNMSVLKAFRLAFLATDNAAFEAAAPEVDASLRRGNTVTSSLTGTGLFPRAYLSGISVAEETGRLPEMCRTLAETYDDLARRRLNTLNKIAGAVIWMMVAVITGTAVLTIAKNVWIDPLNKTIVDPLGKGFG